MVEGTSNNDLLRTPEAITSSEASFFILLLQSLRYFYVFHSISWRYELCCNVPVLLACLRGGVWAVYPFVFSLSLSGIIHSIITAVLSISTISFFSLAAFKCAGTPPTKLWGSYPTVGKGDLENYTFCHYCSKPKAPGTHHCRSCGKCIQDMDHHCPFIGNCVGAANHRSFIAFLISAVLSTLYVSIMSAYASSLIWPQVTYSLGRLNGITSRELVWRVITETTSAFLSSALLLSPRGFVLVYLFISSVAVQIGLSVLLWQQLSLVYEGKTYLSHLASLANNEEGKKDCQNFVRRSQNAYIKYHVLIVTSDSKLQWKIFDGSPNQEGKVWDGDRQLGMSENSSTCPEDEVIVLASEVILPYWWFASALLS
ncbi:protein S-acyltransferase 11-like [Senna tora]|uniref:S-acyltransferase n=1 Tax=Senna tora TaxID=362788 RepID=A0A834SQ39_9FABA|nr:protein S-acyltransferase 11-like [Senna tora]